MGRRRSTIRVDHWAGVGRLSESTIGPERFRPCGERILQSFTKEKIAKLAGRVILTLMQEDVNSQIAIDGPAAAGKSTVAALVAERLGLPCINTGNMYRALTWLALARRVDPEKQPGQVVALLPELDLDYAPDHAGRPVLMVDGQPLAAEVIRTPEVAAKVSFMARIPEVRHWLVAKQRQSARFGPIVMEGRDIGTVVFPHARYKFFVTASPEVRARRRLAQPGEVIDSATVESVAAEIARRDEIDQNRAVSPLRPADDAEIIDTDHLNAEQVAELIAGKVNDFGSFSN